jgi:hypothetical protein
MPFIWRGASGFVNASNIGGKLSGALMGMMRRIENEK